MKILITGASGLLGSNLLTSLQAPGLDVYGTGRTDRYGVGLLTCDLTWIQATEDLFQQIHPDIVFHLAANASESKGQSSPIDMVERNLKLSTNVLRSAINAGVKKFIFVSSISVYGDAPAPWQESATPLPKDVYGVNKLAFEQVLKIMANVYGFEYTILRPHNIYGEYQNMADPSKNVIALFMRYLLERKPYTLFGDGAMRRAFSYVGDLMPILTQAIDSFSGFTINIGSTEDVSIKDLSDLLQKVTGVTVPIIQKPVRPQEISLFLADHGLQKQQFQYKETPLQLGLQRTWEWVRTHPLPPIFSMENEIYVSASH